MVGWCRFVGRPDFRRSERFPTDQTHWGCLRNPAWAARSWKDCPAHQEQPESAKGTPRRHTSSAPQNLQAAIAQATRRDLAWRPSSDPSPVQDLPRALPEFQASLPAQATEDRRTCPAAHQANPPWRPESAEPPSSAQAASLGSLEQDHFQPAGSAHPSEYLFVSSEQPATAPDLSSLFLDLVLWCCRSSRCRQPPCAASCCDPARNWDRTYLPFLCERLPIAEEYNPQQGRTLW